MANSGLPGKWPLKRTEIIKCNHNKRRKQISIENIKNNLAIKNIIGKSTLYKHTPMPMVLGVEAR